MRCGALRRCCAASSNGPRWSEPATCRPPGRWASSTGRSLRAAGRPGRVHRVVAQLRRRLATQACRRAAIAVTPRGRAPYDARVAADGRGAGRAEVPPAPAPAPGIYVLCDVSTSVTSASVFFLRASRAARHFRKMRSFVFIERISEVTDIFEHERNFKTVSERISGDAGVADISGYTDYGGSGRSSWRRWRMTCTPGQP